MYSIENFLENIQPFLEDGNFNEFYAELIKVPNFREVFDKELANNHKWLNSALSTYNKTGFHVWFFLDYVHVDNNLRKDNKLSLMNYCVNTVPTIKVTVFCTTKKRK